MLSLKNYAAQPFCSRLSSARVMKYSPNIPPDPAAWLAMPEDDRIKSIEAFHRSAKVKLPNQKAHAIFHAMVENQLAEGIEATGRALDRLLKGGLDRHDAVHAIGSVVAEHLMQAMQGTETNPPEVVQAQMTASIERLNAKEWLQQFGR